MQIEINLELIDHTYCTYSGIDIICADFVDFVFGSTPDRIKIIIQKSKTGQWCLELKKPNDDVYWEPSIEYKQKYKTDHTLFPLLSSNLYRLFDREKNETNIKVKVKIEMLQWKN